MSTLKVSNINNVAASGGGLVIDANGAVSGGLPSPNRNLLYNGAMQVHQRGTSVTGITTSEIYTADRWNLNVLNIGTFTQSIETDAPTGSGFRKSFRVLCTTADAAPTGSDNLVVQHRLEGQDVQRIAKGTSAAQQLTLSFWVKSNVTGTYIAELRDADNTRFVSASYLVTASATWEKKTVTFPADTTGAFDNDNNRSLDLNFWLGAGSDFTSGTLSTTWHTTTTNRAVGVTNLAAATNNYWQVTGVQLEVGPSATEFEFKSYGQELAECQRYYYRIAPGATDKILGVGWIVNTTVASSTIKFPVSMRTAPSALEQSGTASHYAVVHTNTETTCTNVPVFGGYTNAEMSSISLTASGLTGGQGCAGLTKNSAAYLAWSAEL